MTTTPLVRWISIGVLALLASLVPARRACAQSGGRAVIGVSAYVMAPARPDTIPSARMGDWRAPEPSAEPILVRGIMVREAAAVDDRRPLVVAYVGN